LNPGARLILTRLDRAAGFFSFRGYAADAAVTGSSDFSQSAAHSSGMRVRRPAFTARSLPELISSYAVVLPTLYDLQKSSTLRAALDIPESPL
jgi:hypothetical protein